MWSHLWLLFAVIVLKPVFLTFISEFLLPYKPRPVMVASVARNLVAGALGLQTKVSKEKREEERQKIKAARGTYI